MLQIDFVLILENPVGFYQAADPSHDSFVIILLLSLKGERNLLTIRILSRFLQTTNNFDRN